MSGLFSGDRQDEVRVGGSAEAAFDLGLAYASGSDGLPLDLVQAHRWLNVAALCGYGPALAWRAEIAAEMAAGEIVEAQKLARVTVARIDRKAA